MAYLNFVTQTHESMRKMELYMLYRWRNWSFRRISKVTTHYISSKWLGQNPAHLIAKPLLLSACIKAIFAGKIISWYLAWWWFLWGKCVMFCKFLLAVNRTVKEREVPEYAFIVAGEALDPLLEDSCWKRNDFANNTVDSKLKYKVFKGFPWLRIDLLLESECGKYA